MKFILLLNTTVQSCCWTSSALMRTWAWNLQEPWFPHGLSFRTNLKTALDKVEGYNCCVCDAAAQDTPKATQGIVLRGAKLAADILCSGRREGHTTCNMPVHVQQRGKKEEKKKTLNKSNIMKEQSLFDNTYALVVRFGSLGFLKVQDTNFN